MRSLPRQVSVVLLALLIGTLHGCSITPDEQARRNAAKLERTIQNRGESGGREPDFFRAACTGQTEMAQLLLERGANVNYVDDRFGSHSYSALQCAAVTGSEQIVSLLLRYGADREYKGKAGRTPLELAKQKGYASIVKILEDAPATPPKPLAPAPSATSPPPPPIY